MIRVRPLRSVYATTSNRPDADNEANRGLSRLSLMRTNEDEIARFEQLCELFTIYGFRVDAVFQFRELPPKVFDGLLDGTLRRSGNVVADQARDRVTDDRNGGNASLDNREDVI